MLTDLIFLLPELILYAMFSHKFSSLFFFLFSCCYLCCIYVCCIYLYFSFSTLWSIKLIIIPISCPNDPFSISYLGASVPQLLDGGCARMWVIRRRHVAWRSLTASFVGQLDTIGLFVRRFVVGRRHNLSTTWLTVRRTNIALWSTASPRLRVTHASADDCPVYTDSR